MEKIAWDTRGLVAQTRSLADNVMYTQKKKGTETAPLGSRFGKRLPFAKREPFFPS